MRQRTIVAWLRCPASWAVSGCLCALAPRGATTIARPVYDRHAIAFPFSRRLRAGGLWGSRSVGAGRVVWERGEISREKTGRFSIDVERAKLSKNSVRTKAVYNAMAGGLISLPTRHPAGTGLPRKKEIPYDFLRGLPFGHPAFLAFLAMAASSLPICEYHSRTAGRTTRRGSCPPPF